MTSVASPYAAHKRRSSVIILDFIMLIMSSDGSSHLCAVCSIKNELRRFVGPGKARRSLSPAELRPSTWRFVGTEPPRRTDVSGRRKGALVVPCRSLPIELCRVLSSGSFGVFHMLMRAHLSTSRALVRPDPPGET